jgi:hypothetical protein
MADGDAAHHSAKGIQGFLSNSFAGLPGWVWVVVVVVGIGAAYVLPKLFGGATGASTTDQTSTDAGTNQSGLGLAVDPTTGLPYAVEGLQPAGGLSGGGSVDLSGITNQINQINATLANLQKTPTTGTTGTGTDTDNDANKPKVGGTTDTDNDAGKSTQAPTPAKPKAPTPPTTKSPTPTPTKAPTKAPTPVASQPSAPKYWTVPAWPSNGVSINQIASKYGVSAQRIAQLNPTYKNPATWNDIISSGSQVRYA